MKLCDAFADKGFHSSIVTTFGVDFDAYENIALPRLRGAGCNNNMLFVDDRMLTYALDGASTLPRHAGRLYTVAGIRSTSVFHPKIMLQLGRRSGRAIISSANITSSGLAGNLEIAGMLELESDQIGERQLLRSVFDYLERLPGVTGGAVDHQVDWLLSRTPWLGDTEAADGAVTLSDGSAAAFLATGGEARGPGLGERFRALLGEDSVERLTIISPYWDDELAALRSLVSALAPIETNILVDIDKRQFPADVAEQFGLAGIIDLGSFARGRFLHAKMVIAQTRGADHVLFGSANCTVAALGTATYSGSNHEACLYRRLPRDSVFSSLGLEQVMDEGQRLSPKDLPRRVRQEEVPLEQAAQRSPGRFESTFDTLTWFQRPSIPADVALELLDSEGTVLPVNLTPVLGQETCIRRYHMFGMASRPALARLRYRDGTSSAPAVISSVDVVRDTVRERQGRKTEAALFQLSQGTEEGLWLWEVLNDLENAELEQKKDEQAVRRPKPDRDRVAPETAHKKLTYEQFIAGRTLKVDASLLAQSSLAGTHLSSVRSFLNRVLSIGTEIDGALDADEDEALRIGLDIQEESLDASEDLERGEELSLPSGADRGSDDGTTRRTAVQARANRDQIIRAIDDFVFRLKETAKTSTLGSIDVLRLRALLTIVIAASQGSKSVSQRSDLQVLPLDSSHAGWPKLIGRLLFTFFGGKEPLVRMLAIDAIHNQLPDDLIETWATAFWALNTARLAAETENCRQIQPMLKDLTQRAYLLSGLTKEELLGETITLLIERFDDRFCDRLGIEKRAILAGHSEVVDTVHPRFTNISVTEDTDRRKEVAA